MKRLSFRCLCLALLALSFAVMAASDHRTGARKNIDTVALSIEGIHRDLGTYSVTTPSLKSILSERLGDAGIRVIDMAELADHPQAAVISLRLTLIRSPYYFYLYGLNMAMKYRLPVDGDGGGFALVKTWSDTRNGMLMPSDAGDIKRMSLEMLDKLLRDSGKG